MDTKRKAGEQPQSLPTNLESATREYVRSRLVSWDDKILARRADRLGVSLEEASRVEAKPLFMVEIERRAEAEGRPVESVLEEYSKRLQQSTYPTAACFLPDEVAEYVDGILPLDRLEHASACVPCATLLAAAVPTETAARDLVETLSLTPVRKPAIDELTVAAASGKWAAFDFVVASRWAATVLVPAVALIAMYLAFLSGDRSATRLTFLHNPLPWVVALVAAIATLSVYETNRRPLLRSFAVGIAAAAVLGSSFFVDFRRSQSTRDFAIKLAQDQVADLAVDSIENHQFTGKFIDAQHISDLLQIQTPDISSTQVRYVATSNQLPGKVVANIGASGGDLNWEYGNKTVQQLKLFTGTLEHNADGIRIRVSDGRTFDIPATDRLRNLPPSTPVLAVVDPATASVRSLRILGRVPPNMAIYEKPDDSK